MLKSNRFLNIISNETASLSDKKQAWEDLIHLTHDGDSYKRLQATYVLGSAFPYVPDKDMAWADLIKLTNNIYGFVRYIVASVLGSVLPYVPNKNQVCTDLLRLIQHKDPFVVKGAVYALGSVYPYILDKNQAYADVLPLIQRKDTDIRMNANYFLGKVSIFKATEAKSEEESKRELEKALQFFEKSSNETSYINRASFCLPFYKSFYTITFKKQNAEVEVQKYLNQAKDAVKGSDSKEKLLEAVENLANAMREAKGVQDFDKIKYDLNSYRRYCERAAELIEMTEEKVPGASKLIRMSFPIIDKRIKEIIVEIQEKAKEICKKAKDTPLENLGLETNEKAKKLSVINGFSLEFEFDWMTATAFKFCDFLPSDKKPEICGKITAARNLPAMQKGKIIKETFDYILKNIGFPRINNISISQKREKTVIRIAAVQLNFELMTETFPPKLKDKEATRLKIISALEKAKKNKVDVICFPELCICEVWLPYIRSQYKDMIILPGSYYDTKNQNVCQIISDTSIEIPPQLKINPSAFEDSEIMGARMTPGEKLIHIYETKFGKFAVLICRDFGNFVHTLRGIVDVIFVPSYNPTNVRFHKDADNHVTNSPSYIIISNTALYGGTSIFGQLNKAYFSTLEQGGCKEKGDNSYKLCEIEQGKEEMIIADFDLIHKSPQLQTAINPDEEIKSVKGIKKIEL